LIPAIKEVLTELVVVVVTDMEALLILDPILLPSPCTIPPIIIPDPVV
jgi:hypothetical protein